MEITKSDHRPGFKVKLLVYGGAILMVLVPFLFWKGTWFGTVLDDSKMGEFLNSSARPRDTQHALFQMSQKIESGKVEEVRKWYPAVLNLARHPVPEVRNTVAWLMGQDNSNGDFHDGLYPLANDANPLVRRNAALALVRFGDPAGRPELLNMLKPFVVQAPMAGILRYRLREDDSVDTGTLLARIETGTAAPFELRSVMPGFFQTKSVEDGTPVHQGQDVLVLSPSDAQVWEALRALYLIGEPADLEAVQSFTGKMPHLSERTRQQARLTVAAIQRRSQSLR